MCGSGSRCVKSCTVKAGTKIFVVGYSYECSTFPGDDGGPGLTEAQLRQCARDKDLQVASTIAVDGTSVTVTEVETPGLNIVLPEDNLLVCQRGRKVCPWRTAGSLS
jgi:hypothetical protein